MGKPYLDTIISLVLVSVALSLPRYPESRQVIALAPLQETEVIRNKNPKTTADDDHHYHPNRTGNGLCHDAFRSG